MDLTDFTKDFLEDVKATASTIGEGSVAAFVNIFTEYLQNAEVISDFVPAFYTGAGKKNRKIRVDGYVLDEYDFTLTLIIADYSGIENRGIVTKTNAKQIYDKLLYFIDEAYDQKLVKEIEVSTPVYDLVNLMRFYKAKIRKYRLILITDGLMSDRISTIAISNVQETPVDCQIWDMDRLFKICASEAGRQHIEIDFKLYTENGIPYLATDNTNSDDYKSFLCIIPGPTLADIYDRYGSQLLEGNVRSFLSTKVAVNKKIRETILKLPDKFFAYNNGVSATAMDLKFETTSEGSFITSAKDFQIINGGQTTASLSNARHRDKVDLKPVYVQMKLTEVDSDTDRASDLIRNISRSSNSQNKVSDADFFSTHPFHVRIEQISRRTYATAATGEQFETKWFYERARGQYLQSQMRMTKTEKDKFIAQNPKKQVITKTDLAKVRNSWQGLPQIVSRGAQTNFVKFAENTDEAWIESDIKYNEKYFKDTVALMILFKHIENIVTHQNWYEQGYRANIVTYSLALLHKLISQQMKNKELDLQLIWNRQEVPEIISIELLKITKEVFKAITDPKRETINVTQWCKRDACWTRVKECNIILNNEVEKVLVDKNEEKIANRDAVRVQRIVSDVQAQTKVIECGPEYWGKLNKFVVEKRMGTPETTSALKTAMRIPTKIPSPYESIKLLELLNQAESEGFKNIMESFNEI